MQVRDLAPLLKKALALSRDAGLTDAADELEGRCFAAYTTSSELLGETGEAILRFRAAAGDRLPRKADELLDECLREIGKVCPRYRPGLLGRLSRLLGI